MLGVVYFSFRCNRPDLVTKIKNIPYSWPSAQGGASTVLTNDGAGNLTCGAGGGGGAALPVADTQTIVSGSADPTKLLRQFVRRESFAAMCLETGQPATSAWPGMRLVGGLRGRRVGTLA